MSFGSDNHSGAHPEILKAMEKVNQGHVSSYGNDPYTEKLDKLFQQVFGDDARGFLVLTGTGANVISLQACCRSFEGALLSNVSHMHNDECGAPENVSGAKLVPCPHKDGKLTPELLAPHLVRQGDPHSSQIKLISISQCTELGTVYSLEEIKKLSQFAKSHGLYLHMDGARLSNAAAFLDCTLKELTVGCGVDIVSFGGTKNGMILGEAVICFNSDMSDVIPFLRKQSMQLSSKMRYISAQFDVWLRHNIWHQNAAQANKMAQYLYSLLGDLPDIKFLYPIEANELFVQVPKVVIDELKDVWHFYVWDQDKNQVRWVTSWDTTAAEVEAFAQDIRRLVG